MINLIKADLFRVLRGKGIYITLFVFAAIMVLQVAAKQVGQMGIMVSSESTYEVEYDEEGNQKITALISSNDYSGVNTAFELAKATDNLIWFMLPVIIIVAASDFSGGTAKNLLSGGVSRLKYFFAKFVIVGIFSVVFAALYIIIPVVAATIMYGFGGDFNMEFIGDLAKIYLPQFLLVFAYVCIGVFLTFATKRTAIVNTIYIVLSLAPMMVIAILTEINEKFWKLSKYDLFTNIKVYGVEEPLFGDGYGLTADLKRTLILSAVYILVTVIGGIMLFRKSEIK